MEKGRQQLNANILFSLLADMPRCECAPRITSTTYHKGLYPSNCDKRKPFKLLLDMDFIIMMKKLITVRSCRMHFECGT